MPRIATINPNPDEGLSTLGLKQAAMRAGSRGAESGAMIEGGLRAFGSGIVKLGEQVGQQQQTDYLSKYTQWESDEDQKFEDAKQKADPYKPQEWLSQYLNDRQERLDQFNGQFDGGLWGTGAKQYQERVNQVGTITAAKNAQSFSASMHADAQVASAETATNSIATEASRDVFNLQPYIDKFHAQVEPLLPAEHRATESVKLLQDVADNAAELAVKTLAANPGASTDQIDHLAKTIGDDNDPLGKTMSPGKRGELLDKLAALGKTQDGLAFGLVKQQLPDMLTQIDRGGPSAQAEQSVAWLQAHAKTKEEILAATDAAHDLAQHQQYGTVFAKTKESTNADIQVAIDRTRAAWADAKTPEDRARLKGQETALAQAREQRNSEFHADQASYAIGNDGATNARYRAFAAKPTPDSWKAYSDASSAFQRRLYPGEVPKLVTAEVRDDIRQGVQAITIDKTNGVQTAATTLQKWATLAGPKWTDMSRELHTAGILNDDQFVAATLYGKPSGRHLAEQMLQASAMGKNELYLLHGISSDKASQAAIEQLQPLSQSLGNMGEDGAEIQRANTLALAHLLQLRGDPNQAPDLAKTLVLDEFQFTGRNGSTTLRIPNRPDLDSGRIQAGTESVLSGLGENKNIIAPMSNSGLNPGDQRKVYLDRIQHTGVWYANGSNTGAELWDIDGGSPVQEYGPSANPSFDYKHATGMKQAGNLDPWNRPVLHNPDGSYSTTSSMSIGAENGETLIPTVVNGKRLSKTEAIAHFNKTGENLGVFDTPAHADKFATALHNAQASMYDSHGNLKGGKPQKVFRTWRQLSDMGANSPASEQQSEANIQTSERVLGGAH